MIYEDKLLAERHHPIPDTRLIAILLHGQLGSARARASLDEFLRAKPDYPEPYEILPAVSPIGGPRAETFLAHAAHDDSRLIQALADVLRGEP